MRREVQIMHHLAGHPNVTLLKGAYEDKHHVHLVHALHYTFPCMPHLHPGTLRATESTAGAEATCVTTGNV